MSAVQIRRYENEDYDIVRQLLVSGINSHWLNSFFYVLSKPFIKLTFISVSCLLYLISQSFILPFLAIFLMLLLLNNIIIVYYNTQIESALNSDMLDIKKTYMEAKDSCFWVAEYNGKVVGTVAAVPSNELIDAIELKRMYVKKEHQCQGIGRALCKTVLEFASDNDYQTVMLSTFVFWYDARKFYEACGFTMRRIYVSSSFMGRIFNLKRIDYRPVCFACRLSLF
uniref:N-acetyltransferase domain-containing protein n=1 Tax=Erpetoichthys calabaricus TaxID=27687 RepID=A0A8C4RZD6_ERPCA